MKRKTTPPLTGKEKEVKELTLALIAEWKKSSERERGQTSNRRRGGRDTSDHP